MSDLSKEAQHVLLHTLGLTNSSESYRNRFIAGDGHYNMPHLRELEAAGLMEERLPPAF